MLSQPVVNFSTPVALNWNEHSLGSAVTVIGEPANLASRYCSAAGKGEILISPEIHAHVFNKFTLERKEIPTKHEGTIVAYRIKK